MPLRPGLVRTFHRTLFAGWNQMVTLLKRGDDQNEGTVTQYKLFNCRWSMIASTGEMIQADMTADHRRILHIPRIELDYNGIPYINSLDIFVDSTQGRYWQKEATTEQHSKLSEQHLDIFCLRVDPPGWTENLGPFC
jgi:hypothetical protein